MRMADSRAEQDVKPVRIHILHPAEFILKFLDCNLLVLQLLDQPSIPYRQDCLCILVTVCIHLLLELHPFLGIHHIIESVCRTLADTDITTVIDRQSSPCGSLRSYDNDTVGRLGSVDCGRCGILQDSDGLYICRIKPGYGISGCLGEVFHISGNRARIIGDGHRIGLYHPINDPQRFLIPQNRGCSPDPDLRSTTDLSGSVQDGHSGNDTLKHLVYCSLSGYKDILGLDLGDGTYIFTSVIIAISCHDNLIQSFQVILEGHVQMRLSCIIDFLNGISQAGKDNGPFFSPLEIQVIIPDRIGFDTDTGAFDHDGHTR